MKKISTILIGLTFLTSCDCNQRVSGIVIDKETGRPLQGVKVYNKDKEWSKTITDSTGHFELSNASGSFRCPPMIVVADFKHYKKIEISIPAGGQETIELQRQPYDPGITIQIMQGLWFHDQDSLASLKISNFQWTFLYKREQTNSDNIYSISITKKIGYFIEGAKLAEFLMLTNKVDTLEYEILELTDSTFSMMYLPEGKIHLYKRRE
ncbi:MAG: carboxypeptidase-like regulatory domain-containing protein [Chitinophagales bacterium]|nr:carboxypeptidase-like regulatory domain-containing protein [Chitinophagales bacterium]